MAFRPNKYVDES